MIRPNVAPRDYRMLLSHGASLTLSDPTTRGANAYSASETTWGAAYVPAVTGIRRLISATHGLSADDTLYSVVTPWGSWSVDPATFDPPPFSAGELWLQLDGVSLSAHGSPCEYALSIDRLRVWRGDYEGTPVLDLSGPLTDGGSYDGRDNVASRIASGCTAVPASGRRPSCSPTEAGIPDPIEAEVDAAATDGYEWRTSETESDPAGDWTRDDAALLALPGALVPEGCECSTGDPPSATWEDPLEPGTSWRVRCTSYYRDSLSIEDDEVLECHCPPGSTELDVGHTRHYTLVVDRASGAATCGVVPVDWGIKQTTVSRSGLCVPFEGVTEDDPDEDEETTDEEPDVCPVTIGWNRYGATLPCVVTLDSPTCVTPPGSGGGGPGEGCEAGPHSGCGYGGTIRVLAPGRAAVRGPAPPPRLRRVALVAARPRGGPGRRPRHRRDGQPPPVPLERGRRPGRRGVGHPRLPDPRARGSAVRPLRPARRRNDPRHGGERRREPVASVHRRGRRLRRALLRAQRRPVRVPPQGRDGVPESLRQAPPAHRLRGGHDPDRRRRRARRGLLLGGPEGEMRVHLQHFVGGDLVFATSPDGKDFS